MSEGIYYRSEDWTGRVVSTPVTAEECWKCGKERPDLAHAVYEYVGALLAERLRDAFDAHLAEHGCAQRTGFGYCDEGHAPVLADAWRGSDLDRLMIARDTPYVTPA